MATTILVVDDHPMVLQMVKSMLRHHGYHVLAAADGGEALRLYDLHGADAAIVDVDMPGLTGPEVCRELTRRAHLTGRPLVLWMMTGVVRPELADEVQNCGALGVIAKPFTPTELLLCFEEHGIHGREPALAR